MIILKFCRFVVSFCSGVTYINFFNEILEPLFYEALRYDRRYDDNYYSSLNCKIPFLNGGLFDPINDYDWAYKDINLPNKLFSNSVKTKEGDTGNGILDIFDRFNFTVKEDEPLDKEVAIDPEMLGKVFENLLEVRDRKSKGTYYTPREIVHYMCQQSLINYLFTELNKEPPIFEKVGDNQLNMIGNETKQGQLDITIKHQSDVAVPKEDIEFLVIHGDDVIENEAVVAEKGVETKTYSYKIKPCIRNNAELIDQKLADIKVCDPAVGSGAFLVSMMTEIVKARNVLSAYIKDLDRNIYRFKRECIEKSLYGVDIDSGAVEIAKLRLWLSLIVEEEEIKNIRQLPNLNYKIVCGNSLLNVEKNLFNNDLFLEMEKIKSHYFSETSPIKKQEYKHQIDKLISQITNGHKEFDFEVYFSEVFSLNDGFDVVLGNPPYIDSERMTKEMTEERNLLRHIYSTTRGNWDYYIPFWESSVKHLNNNGCACLITPNKWLVATYGKNLRDYIANTIERISDFSSFRVFENVGAFPVVVAVKKTQSSNKIRVEKYNEGFTLDYFKEVERDMLIKQPIWGMLISIHMDILLKMMRGNILLSDVCSIENPFTVSEAYKFLPLLNSYQKKSEYDPRRDYKFINTGTIDPFITLWGIRDTRYIKNRFLCPYVEKSKFSNKFSENRNSQAASEKLIFSGMRFFEVYYDEMGEWIAGKSTVIAKNFSREYSGRILLGLLNSKIVKFFMYETYRFLGMDGGIGFSTTNISTIPLPNLDQYSNTLTVCVDNLLEKIAHNHEDTKKIFESHEYGELNSLIYRLYGLTEEEIAIVEKSVGR